MKRRILLVSLVFVMLFSISANSHRNRVSGAEPLMNLVYDSNDYGGIALDYGLYIAQYLQQIGIEVEVKVEEWSVFIGDLILTRDYDFTFERHSFSNSEPDFNFMYDTVYWIEENSGYPYIDEFIEMIEEGPTIDSFEERVQHYHELQEFYMDKILFYYPLAATQDHGALWSNTEGFSKEWGWIESSPYMSYNGYHEGQVSLNEFTFADANWRELNPLLTDYRDGASANLWDLMSEPLIKCDPLGYPTHNGMIQNWLQLNDTHYKFFMRPGVYWNPSYNVTGRTPISVPLSDAPLMTGLKGEFSNGTNQMVTAKDAVFTLLSWSNNITSEKPEDFNWLKDVYIDPGNPYSFHVHVDGDPSTPEEENFSLLFKRMELGILPEFFLNSSIPLISYTTNGIECRGLSPAYLDSPQWVTYSTSAFGTGKFLLDYYIRNSVTVIQKSPFWFGVGAINGSTGMEPFVDTINIRVIPDRSAELAEFKAGKLDLTDISYFHLEREQMRTNPSYIVFDESPTSMDVLAFNIRRPHLGGENNFIWLTEPGYENYTRSLAVRKAICHAVDRMEMVDVILNEYTLPDCPIPQSIGIWYNYNIQTRYYYDLQMSLGWLARAGYDLEAAGLVTPTTIPTSTFTLGTNTFTIDFPLPILPVAMLAIVLYMLRRKKFKQTKG